MEKTKKIILKVLFMLILVILFSICKGKEVYGVKVGDTISISCPRCGHCLGKVQSYKPATCTSAGTISWRCSRQDVFGYRCKGTGTITQKALGHLKYVTTYSVSSCTTNKKGKYECQRAGCSWSEWKEVPGSAPGHDFSKTVMDKKGTCTERGYVIKQCSRCTARKDVTPGSSQGSAYAVQGHKYQREDVKPTCGKAGHIYNICIVCGYTQNLTPGSSQGSPYAPTGEHNYVNGVCTVCGAKNSSGSTGGTSTHYHTWKEATCIDPKECTSCGETSGNALGHEYNSDGVCTRCGKSNVSVVNTWDLTGNGLVGPIGSATATLTEDGTLIISGEGYICNYDKSNSPTAKDINPITNRDRIKKVHITGKMRNIGSYLFYYATNLTEVIIDHPETIEYIGEGAFFGCKSLQQFTIPQNVTQIGARAFCHCHKLQEMDLTTAPKLTRISHETFRDCWLLETVKMPEGLKIIGYEAFFNCISLKNVIIPSTVTSFGTLGVNNDPAGIGNESQFTGDKEFDNTSGFNNVFTIDFSRNGGQEDEYQSYITAVLKQNNASELVELLLKTRVWYYADNTTLATYANQKASTELKMSPLSFDISEKQDKSVIAALNASGKLTITGTGRIKDYNEEEIPWNEVKTLVPAVEVGEGITTIGKNLFNGCENLQSVQLPSTLEEIHYGAFQGCKSLPSIDLPNNLKKIEAYAFAHCENLASITIPQGVDKLLGGTFSNCYKLASVKVLGDITTISDLEFYNCPALTTYRVSPYITEIGKKAFALDSSLSPTGKVEYYECSKVMSDYVAAYSSERTFEKKTIDELAINTETVKMEYYKGETLNTEGLKLNVSYYNGSTLDNKLTKELFEGFTCTPTKLETVGTQKIEVAYGGKTTSFNVTVKEIKLEEIEIKQAPTKTDYKIGDTINTEGLILTATYNNGETKEITEGFTCTPTKLDKEGIQEITVSYEGKTVTYEVKVSAGTLTKVEVKTNPNKTTYTVGDNVDLTGLVLKLTYDTGFTKEITEGFTCTPTKLDKEGTQTITVTYEGKTTTFTVTVKAPTLNSIAIKTKPSKVTYTAGDTLNTTGLVLTATYSNGTTKEITEGFTCTPTKLDKEGTQTITVTYEGKTATFTVTVKAPTLNSIAIKTKPSKVTYTVGDTLSTTGLVLTATYSNGTTKEITEGFTCTPTKLDKEGTQTITVAYGGKTTTFTVMVNKKETEKININSDKYKLEANYIKPIQPKTTVKALIEKITTNATSIKVYKNDTVLKDTDYVGTGMKIVFSLGEETKTYTLIVLGDINGDGEANFLDIVSMNKHRLGKKILSEEEKLAGDVVLDGEVDFKDIVKVNKFRLNKIKEL